MKPLRLNKLKSNLSFLLWLANRRLFHEHRADFDHLSRDQLDASPWTRVDYYCKLTKHFHLKSPTTIENIPYFKKTGYNFDFHRIMYTFPAVRFDYLWGDIKHVPDSPTFVRSRPINCANDNSILLPLNTRRLFETYKDPYSLKEKKPGVVWRGAVYKQHRIDLLLAGEKNVFCDFGAVNKGNPTIEKFLKNWMTPLQQMAYKFIFVIEGNDIASNIRWAMASNSVVMMRKPRFESWFSEGKLKAGEHYIEITDDFSDIAEKFDYFQKHEDETKRIVENANRYVKSLGNLPFQYTLAKAVVKKYAFLSGQLTVE